MEAKLDRKTQVLQMVVSIVQLVTYLIELGVLLMR